MCPGLLVQQPGEGERELLLVAVIPVGDRVHDRHRPRHGDLELLLRVRPREPRLDLVHAPLQLERPHDHRDHRLVAIVADAHLDLVLEVDPFDGVEEPVHEVLPGLLAVGHDVQARVLLLLQPEECGIALEPREVCALRAPLGPELVGFGEPVRLGQAARDRRLEHSCLLDGRADHSVGLRRHSLIAAKGTLDRHGYREHAAA
jgi:hypothetical protein